MNLKISTIFLNGRWMYHMSEVEFCRIVGLTEKDYTHISLSFCNWHSKISWKLELNTSCVKTSNFHTSLEFLSVFGWTFLPNKILTLLNQNIFSQNGDMLISWKGLIFLLLFLFCYIFVQLVIFLYVFSLFFYTLFSPNFFYSFSWKYFSKLSVRV